MLSAVPATSRRGVLAGGAALAALGVVVSACGESPKTPAVEDLLEPLDQAKRDSALASAAAAAAGNPPQIGAALTMVATQRAAHARALATEIARAAGKVESSSNETTNPSPTDAGAQPPPQPPPLSDVVNALRTSAESASRLLATSSGYQAGLLGSIAASCTVSYSIALVPAGPTP